MAASAHFPDVAAHAGSIRLLTRGRSDFSPGWATRLAFGRFPIEPITFVMSRKVLLEIKRLAEMGC